MTCKRDNIEATLVRIGRASGVVSPVPVSTEQEWQDLVNQSMKCTAVQNFLSKQGRPQKMIVLADEAAWKSWMDREFVEHGNEIADSWEAIWRQEGKAWKHARPCPCGGTFHPKYRDKANSLAATDDSLLPCDRCGGVGVAETRP